MRMTVSEFEKVNFYSNENIQRMLTEAVNSSANAVLVNVYEDKVILLDHAQGRFYSAEYTFDPKTTNMLFENFEEFELTKSESDFNNVVHEYFADEDNEPHIVAEAYLRTIQQNDTFINMIVNESMSKKDFQRSIDYSEMMNVEKPALTGSYVQIYESRMQERPLSFVPIFTWDDSVRVTLYEGNEVPVVITSAHMKAKDLWKLQDFSSSLIEAYTNYQKDEEDGIASFHALFEEYPTFFMLPTSERKEMIGKLLLREGESNFLKHTEVMMEIFEDNKFESEYALDESYDEAMNEYASELDVSLQDIEEMQEALLTAQNEMFEDNSMYTRVDYLVEQLEEMKTVGTKPAIVKEVVAIMQL